MRRMILAPSRYIQGEGELAQLTSYIGMLGHKPFILVDAYIAEHYVEYICQSIEETIELIKFTGECSYHTINRLLAQNFTDQDVVVGIGGGKTLDVAKVIAAKKNIPIIICPTVASTDAPTSSLSVIYSEDGAVEEVLQLKKNPDIVLVDTQLIAKAPTRFLVAGMGDAVSTFFEMRSNRRAQQGMSNGEQVSRTVYAIGKACYETLLDKGYEAVQSSKEGVISTALEDVIEVNIYMSGIGFESGGCALAHAIDDALTVLEDTHKMLHGERVAFGTLCQLVMEGAPQQEIKEVRAFCKHVGLPLILADIGIAEKVEEKVRQVAERCHQNQGLLHTCPFEVDVEHIYQIILDVDRLGS